MAAFNPSQYHAVVNKIESGLNTVMHEKLPELQSALNSVLGKWYIPDFVKDSVKWMVKEIVHCAEFILEKIQELMKGAAAPLYLFEYSWKWGDIKGAATTVAGEISPGTVTPKGWSGSASDAYTGAITSQSKAAAEIGSTISTATIISLTTVAAAGLAFYVTLGIILFQLIASLVGAIVLLGTLVLSWLGLGEALGEVTVSAGAITAAVVALAALVGAQASQMAVLHGHAEDNAAFPGGHWPKAAAS